MIAVIGCGHWGKNLIRCFYELGQLYGVLDLDKNKIDSVVLNFPHTHIFSCLEEILSNSSIRGVVIATPAETHFEIAQKCLLSGKHILLEKPMTLSSREAQELIVLSDKNNCIILVGHVLEYSPAIIKLRQLVVGGEIGQIKELYSNRLSPGRIRQFENVWWSFAPHDILLICKTVNSEIEYLSCVSSDHFSRGIADSTITCFKFVNGCFAHIHVSWTHPFNEQKFVVVGTCGAIEFSDSKQKDKLILYKNNLTFENNVAKINKGHYEVIEYEGKEPLLEECRDFLVCIKTGKMPCSSGQDGLKVVTILEKAMEVCS